MSAELGMAANFQSVLSDKFGVAEVVAALDEPADNIHGTVTLTMVDNDSSLAEEIFAVEDALVVVAIGVGHINADGEFLHAGEPVKPLLRDNGHLDVGRASVSAAVRRGDIALKDDTGVGKVNALSIAFIIAAGAVSGSVTDEQVRDALLLVTATLELTLGTAGSLNLVHAVLQKLQLSHLGLGRGSPGLETVFELLDLALEIPYAKIIDGSPA